VNELMDARQAVKAAETGDLGDKKNARAAVQAAKVARGGREQIWRDDGATDLNWHVVENTPYAVWYQQLRIPRGYVCYGS
jgi:hypothetical protein